MRALKHPYIWTDPLVAGTREKVEFFVKVILHHRNVVGEEVFVNYSLEDPLV